MPEREREPQPELGAIVLDRPAALAVESHRRQHCRSPNDTVYSLLETAIRLDSDISNCGLVLDYQVPDSWVINGALYDDGEKLQIELLAEFFCEQAIVAEGIEPSIGAKLLTVELCEEHAETVATIMEDEHLTRAQAINYLLTLAGKFHAIVDSGMMPVLCDQDGVVVWSAMIKN